jgi:hypothetical protein
MKANIRPVAAHSPHPSSVSFHSWRSLSDRRALLRRANLQAEHYTRATDAAMQLVGTS